MRTVSSFLNSQFKYLSTNKFNSQPIIKLLHAKSQNQSQIKLQNQFQSISSNLTDDYISIRRLKKLAKFQRIIKIQYKFKTIFELYKFEFMLICTSMYKLVYRSKYKSKNKSKFNYLTLEFTKILISLVLASISSFFIFFPSLAFSSPLDQVETEEFKQSQLSHVRNGVTDPNSYYGRKAEGWFFYGEPGIYDSEDIQNQSNTKSPNDDKHKTSPLDPEKVPLTTGWLRKNLPKYLDLAIDNPTPENVLAYFYLQRLSLDRASTFAQMAGELIPGNTYLDENIRRPVSTLGSSLLDRRSQAARKLLLKNLGNRISLVYLFDSSDPQSEMFSALVKNLETTNGFYVKTADCSEDYSSTFSLGDLNRTDNPNKVEISNRLDKVSIVYSNNNSSNNKNDSINQNNADNQRKPDNINQSNQNNVKTSSKKDRYYPDALHLPSAKKSFKASILPAIYAYAGKDKVTAISQGYLSLNQLETSLIAASRRLGVTSDEEYNLTLPYNQITKDFNISGLKTVGDEHLLQPRDIVRVMESK